MQQHMHPSHCCTCNAKQLQTSSSSIMHMNTGGQQQPGTAVSYSTLQNFRSDHRCAIAAVSYPPEVRVGCKEMSIQHVLKGGLSYAFKVYAEALCRSPRSCNDEPSQEVFQLCSLVNLIWALCRQGWVKNSCNHQSAAIARGAAATTRPLLGWG